MVHNVLTADRIRRMELLVGHLRPSRLPRLCDVGANPVTGKIYKALLERNLCEVHGFEPEERAFQALMKERRPNETIHQKAIGRPGRRILYVHRHNFFTSLYRPCAVCVAEMGHPEWADPAMITEVPIETSPLDAIEELPPIDILKMDLQGGELEVLETGQAKLADAVAIITEVRFFRFYEGEPMFADQDAMLNRMGFRLHKFVDWNNVKVAFKDRFRTAFALQSQVVDADAAYLPAGNLAERLSTDQLIFLALAADTLFDSPDLVMHCLDILHARGAAERRLLDLYLTALPRHLRRGF